MFNSSQFQFYFLRLVSFLTIVFLQTVREKKNGGSLRIKMALGATVNYVKGVRDQFAILLQQHAKRELYHVTSTKLWEESFPEASQKKAQNSFKTNFVRNDHSVPRFSVIWAEPLKHNLWNFKEKETENFPFPGNENKFPSLLIRLRVTFFAVFPFFFFFLSLTSSS